MTPGVLKIDGYEILRELGRGAMGVVFLARDTLLEREVAIKIIGAAAENADAIERFLWEARATARLSHPNVVTVFRAGAVPSGPFIVMELLRGRSLEQVLAADGKLSPTRLLQVALESTRGLAAAHARGIVHRDIKPSNLFETADGTVKLLDFGIAKVSAVGGVKTAAPARASTDDPNDTANAGQTKPSRPDTGADTLKDPLAQTLVPETVTETAARSNQPGAFAATVVPDGDRPSTGKATQITGTPLFIAPEVWREEGADHASDVWSLGATLYALATGAPPFAGKTIPEIAFNVMVATPAVALATARKDVMPALGEVIDRCLAKDRSKRFASAHEMLTVLERVARDARDHKAIEGSPYPGLRTMTVDDRDKFFGRDEDVARIVERLRSEALVVLVGPSGAGKSSLAGAGVAPAVAEGALGAPARWRVVRVLPGRSPVRALGGVLAALGEGDPDEREKALRDGPDALARELRAHVTRTNEGVLLWIDQLEELVTLASRDEREIAGAALARLIELSPAGVRVLATARSDLFDRLGTLGDIGVMLGRATEIVRPLTGQALRQAIAEPARRAGATFEDEAILDEIVREAGDASGALPLIAFAMRAWWERRDRQKNVLTVASWRAVGGIHGALGAHAESVYAGLRLEDGPLAREMFLLLVATDGTRRYANRAELLAAAGDAATLTRVLDAFTRARLLLMDGEGDDVQVTLAHEALARAWPRYSGWQSEGAEDRVLLERLRTAAATWEAAGCPADLLWRGAMLDGLLRWREIYDDQLRDHARTFADAAALARRRARRKLLSLGGVVGGIAFAGILAASVALVRFRNRAADDAIAHRRDELRSGREGMLTALHMARSLRDRDRSAALAWLAHAARRGGRVTAGMRVAALTLEAGGAPVRFECAVPPAVRPDGARFACADGDRIYVADIGTGEVRTINARERVIHVAIAARARRIAWIDENGLLTVRDGAQDAHPLHDPVRNRPLLELDPDGEALVLLERVTGRLTVFDAQSGEIRAQRDDAIPAADRDRTRLTALDGALLGLTRRTDGTVTLRRWGIPTDAASRAQPFVPTHTVESRNVVVAGARVVTAEGNVARHDAESGTERTCPTALHDVRDVALAPDGSRVAWLARTEDAAPTAGWVDVASCTVTTTDAVGIDGLAFLTDGAIAGWSAQGGLRRVETSTNMFGPPWGAAPSLPQGARALAVGRDFVLVAGAQQALWRGDAPWPSPLGLPESRVTFAAVDAREGRAVVVDDADRVHVYPVPLAWRAGVSRWRETPAPPPPAASASTVGPPDVRVVSLPHGHVGVVAAGYGAVTVDVQHGGIDWQSASTAPLVDAAGRYGLLVQSSGAAQRVEFEAHRVTAGVVLEGRPPAVVAIAADGRRAIASDDSSGIALRDLGRIAWPTVAFRWFGELAQPTALGVASDCFAIAARRFGVLGRGGQMTFADAPSEFYGRHVRDVRIVGERNIVAADDQCDAWRVRCFGIRCEIERAAVRGTACRIAVAGDDALVTLSPSAGLRTTVHGVGDFGPLLSSERVRGRGASAVDAVALAVGDDALVLAGAPWRPYVIRFELPPATVERFAAWVLERVNVEVIRGEARSVEPPAELP